jgi:hypothetical protein
MHDRITTLFLMLLSVFFGCLNTQKHSYQPPALSENPVEGMMFLTFVIRADSTLGKRIELRGKTIVHEQLQSEPENSEAENRILISQFGSKLQKLSFTVVEHPLFRRVEYENEKRELQTKSLNLKDAQFFVRVTLFTQTEYILVEEELQNKIVYRTTFNIRD